MGVIRRIPLDDYQRFVPEAREPFGPERDAWGLGEFVFFLGTKRGVREEVHEWLAMSDVPYYAVPTHVGLFIELKDAPSAVMLMMRFA